MTKNEEFFKRFYKLFLTKKLDITLTEFLKLMNLDRSTFYYRFYFYSNFVEKFFNYYSKDLINARKQISTNNLFEIIEEINTLMIKDLMKFKDIIEFRYLSSNIDLFYEDLKKRYKLLILNNLTDKYFLYKNKKYDSNIVLEEGFFSLINHIKNKDLNFSRFYIVSK